MAALTEVFVVVKPDTDKFGPEVKRKLAKIDAKKEGSQVATRFGVGMNGAMGGIVSKSAGIFAAGFAAIQGVKVFGGFIKDAAESAKISRITANAIRATGGAAKITSAQVGDLATAISNKTAIDDEQVQTAANMLLTFKNIRNEAGKNNDIFNRATQAAADLSIQFGGMDGASKQLGKALNDPIKGTTALAKAGVTFTDQQKKQIKTLQESGDILGAQKIILKEIEGQVGGAAAAAADPMERLKVVAGNLGEEIGGVLLPGVNKFATFISDKAIPAISELFGFFKTGDFTKGFREAFHVEEDSKFVDFLFKVRDGASAAFGFFKTDVVPILKSFGGYLLSTVIPAVGQFIGSLAGQLGPVIRDAFGYFKSDVLPILQEFATFFYTKILPAVSAFVSFLVTTLVPVVRDLVTKGMDGAKAAIDRVKTAFKENEPQIRKFIEVVAVVVNWVAGKLGPILGWLAGKQMKWVGDRIALVITAFGKFITAIQAVITWVKDAGTKIAEVWTAVKTASQSALAFVVQKFLGFVGAMITGAAKAFGWVPGIGPKLKTAAAEFDKFKRSVNADLAGINDQVIKITPVVLSATGSSAAKSQAAESKKYGFTFARGGGVFGEGTATSDSIPAMLSNGEHVWTAKEVSKAGGHGAVESMRKSVMAYAKGGPVGLNVKGDFPYYGKSISSVANMAVAVARPIAQALGNVLAKINPGLDGVLKFVKSQVGKPYSWGGVGPGGYDCSGLVSAAINVARGKRPYSRLGATGSMPWSGFGSGPGAFEVGWFKGNPGHTAATVNGVNIESAGGVGVRMGKSARGARNSLFTNRAHVKGFAGGGPILFDKGGYLPIGRSLVENRTGKPEPLTRTDQAMELSDKSIERLAFALSKASAGALSQVKMQIVGRGNSAYALLQSNG